VALRAVRDEDVEEFFEHQREPESVQMAAFPARERDAVVGNIVCWDQGDQTLLGYWIGKRFWGKGLATRALELLAAEITRRPLHAFVAVHNAGSMRVLEKCGFRRVDGPAMAEDGIEEYLYELAA
jgi:RimJ/RimL family protein N-acetyltransferase